VTDGEPRRVLLGIVVGAHGVRGDVRIKSFTDEPTDIGAYGPLSDEAGRRSWRIEPRAVVRGAVVARMDGIGDRNAAEAIKGLRLYVERTALPETAEREWYETDLLGLQVVGKDGTDFGRVLAFHDYGAGTSMEVSGATGGKSLVVPFTDEAVPEVDLAARRVVIDPPPGLLGSDGDESERRRDEE
jgi:16S rRNA processing protein RimM